MACCQRGRAKTFCEDGNVAMLDGLRLTADSPEAEQELVLAGFLSGNGLMDVCDGTKPGELNANVSDYDSCVSYVQGVADAETVFVVIPDH